MRPSGPTRNGRHILMVAPQPFYEDRGTPIAVRQVAEALSQLGYAVDLLTFPVGRRVEVARVRVLRAANPLGIESVPIGFSGRKLALDVTLVSRLASLLRQRRYTCIHAVEEAIFPALWLGGRRGLPVIYDMQSSLAEQLSTHPVLGRGPLRRFTRRMERWALGRATYVVSSTGLAERVRRMHPDARLREWRYPSLAVEVHDDDRLELRDRLGIGRDVPVVLYSGTFEAYQGLEELVSAVPLVRSRVPDAVFVLVGAVEPGGVALTWGSSGLVADGALHVLTRQPREEIPTFLAMADVLVSPRAYGGNLPLKVFDYLAAGRAIVATDIPTHRTVLNDERAVLVAPRHEALAEAIANLLLDHPRAEQLGEAGRQYAVAHFGWSRFLASVRDLYEEVRCGASR